MMLISVFVPLVLADLPVHCLRRDVIGAWTFHLSAPGPRTRCGHTSPDSPSNQPAFDLADYPNNVAVTLADPSNADVGGESGGWSMVYDEGFEVKVGSKVFFAFNGFDGSLPANGQIETYKSDCGKTQVGWYSDGDQYGCFVAEKSSKPALLQTPVRKLLRRQLSWIQEQAVTQEQHQAHVDRINSVQQGWTAKVYKHLVNKTKAQLSQMSGIRRGGVKATKPIGESFLQLETHSEAKARVRSFPTDFDWRNKDGKDYVQNPVDQGSCGSCYVVASMSMMTARRRILEDDPKAEAFSAQFPLFCGEYNQGCDGGYPELVAKWGHDVGLLPESCAAYDVDDPSCKVTCDVNGVDKYKVGDYGYIGGYYGASKEANMMEEVYNRGPIAIAIEPQDDFMYYSSGVYSHASAVKLFDEWTKVDHAVLLTGWGEEDGKKYWRVQNSWGADWGEAGTFRIRRGVDESAVEAQAVYATVEKVSAAPNMGLYT
jgi:cathepsin C